MTAQALNKIDAKAAKKMIMAGTAVLIDVREPDEYVKEHIPHAHLVPLSGFNPADFPTEHEKVAIFHCHSGGRTEASAPQILRTGFREVYQLEGGINAWRAAGLRVNENAKAPISIMRQVQITAGSLVVLGILLAVLVNPWFMALSGFVGAGLAQSGVTGTCGMAHVLKLMPWNKITGGQPVIATPANI